MVKLIVLSGGNGVNKTKDNIQWQNYKFLRTFIKGWEVVIEWQTRENYKTVANIVVMCGDFLSPLLLIAIRISTNFQLTKHLSVSLLLLLLLLCLEKQFCHWCNWIYCSTYY